MNSFFKISRERSAPFSHCSVHHKYLNAEVSFMLSLEALTLCALNVKDKVFECPL